MPPNTVSVCRPTKWGNPFRLLGDQIFVDAGHRRKIFSKWVLLCFGDEEKVVRLFESALIGRLLPGDYGIDIDGMHDILYHSKRLEKLDLGELKGKDLACFCPPDCPCHADVLIRRVLSLSD